MTAGRSPRERLLETASRLFYERGLTNVGINEVTDSAGVARMTLYNTFGSKEALALAAYEEQARERRTLMEQRLEQAASPRDAVLLMFELSETFATDPGYRGCPFINVAVQDPQPDGAMHALVREHKDWIRTQFRSIAEAAEHPRPDKLAQQLLALLDGASMESFIQGSVEPIRASADAAAILLAQGPS